MDNIKDPFLKKEYGRMQRLLLLTAACIPFDQTLLSVLLAVTLFYGFFLLRKEADEAKPAYVEGRVWPLFLKTVLLFLLMTGYLSLHNPLIKEKTACYFNFFYVVGQYVAVVCLFTRFGNYFAGRPRFAEDQHVFAGQFVLQSFWQQCKIRPFIMRVMAVLCLTALISVAAGIGQHYFGGATASIWVDREANPLLHNRVYSTWENPNIFAGYLCVVAAFLMGFIGEERNSRRRWLLFGFLLLVLVCEVFTFSRGFWAAMAAEVILFVLFFYRKGILYLLGVVAAGAILAGPVVWQRLATLRHVMEDSSAALRLGYLEIAQAIIADHPWGIGWYNYRYIFPEYDYYLKDPSVIMYHSHNLFLNITAELGFQGLLFFLLAWGALLRSAWRLHKKGRCFWIRAVGKGYLLMSVGLFTGGLGDHILFNVRMGILFWLLSTLVILCLQYNQYGEEDIRKTE